MTRNPFDRPSEPVPREPESLDTRGSRKTFLFEFTGLLLLLGGFLAYWLFLELQQSPLLTRQSPKPTTPSPTLSPTRTPTPSPTLSPPIVPERASSPKPALDATAEIYQRSPRPGVYYAANSLLGNSRREIAGGGDRYCIKLVNGALPQAGTAEQIVISSLSFREDGIYIDATQEKLSFDRTYTEFTDRLSTWQLLERKENRAGRMTDCLSSREPYIQQAP